MTRNLYAYEYADVAYDDAIELLATDAPALLQDATEHASDHAGTVVATVHTSLAGFELGRDVAIEVGEFEPREMLRVTIPLQWHATGSAGLFPSVDAHLELAALSLDPPRTQVSLVGSYDPPFGLVGEAADAAIGHRVAESTVKAFVQDVAARLEHRLDGDLPS